MPEPTVRIVMNGVTGRMGYRQHLVRSVLAIRQRGGLVLDDGRRVPVEPILVGRNAGKLADLARRHDIEQYTTDLDTALSDATATVYFDAQVTGARHESILRAIAAGKHVYTEKPLAENSRDAAALQRAAAGAGIIHGVVHDKLYLPGFKKLRRLVESGFFGRLLSVRGEFGYWVFDGRHRQAQRPSWNYRAADGGGIVLDMFPHWNYVIENLFGRPEAVTAHRVTHLTDRWDENGEPYSATADDAAYAFLELPEGIVVQVNSSWAVRVNRRELVEFQVDGTNGSAVAGLFDCRVQSDQVTPRAHWDPDVPTDQDFLSQWVPVPEDGEPENGFCQQWTEFLRDVAAGRPHRFDFASGVRGLQLVEASLESARSGRRVALAEAAK